MCIRRHVRLHALASEGGRYVCRLLLVRTENGVGGLLCYSGRWTREDACLISTID